jgi:16S rRNA (guanine966-N2)-methyltransferase
MSHRVIAGSAKGRQLKLVPGDTTRPVMDRVKESLFNIIGRDIFDAAICDFFGGTGAIAIEALSRGAAHALIIDLEPQAIETIRENLKLTKLLEKATIKRGDAFKIIAKPPPQLFHYLYVAPPQYKGFWKQALVALEGNPAWLHDEMTVIVQIDPTEREAIALTRLELYDERKYGSTLLLFYAVKSSAPDAE